jgi:hypothetical protein
VTRQCNEKQGLPHTSLGMNAFADVTLEGVRAKVEEWYELVKARWNELKEMEKKGERVPQIQIPSNGKKDDFLKKGKPLVGNKEEKKGEKKSTSTAVDSEEAIAQLSQNLASELASVPFQEQEEKEKRKRMADLLKSLKGAHGGRGRGRVRPKDSIKLPDVSNIDSTSSNSSTRKRKEATGPNETGLFLVFVKGSFFFSSSLCG